MVSSPNRSGYESNGEINHIKPIHEFVAVRVTCLSIHGLA